MAYKPKAYRSKSYRPKSYGAKRYHAKSVFSTRPPKAGRLPKARRPKQTFIQRSRSKGAEEKAIYHNIAGAGKGRVLRKFFELNDDDVNAIIDIVEAGIQKAIDGV